MLFGLTPLPLVGPSLTFLPETSGGPHAGPVYEAARQPAADGSGVAILVNGDARDTRGGRRTPEARIVNARENSI